MLYFCFDFHLELNSTKRKKASNWNSIRCLLMCGVRDSNPHLHTNLRNNLIVIASIPYVIGMLLLCDCFDFVFAHSSKKNVCFTLSKLHSFFIWFTFSVSSLMQRTRCWRVMPATAAHSSIGTFRILRNSVNRSNFIFFHLGGTSIRHFQHSISLL